MKINRHNYEAYFLDYSEGNLTPEGVEELVSFLALHPDLKAELSEFEILELEDDEQLEYLNKNHLKKDAITELQADDLFVAHIEGDIDEQQSKQLKVLLSKSQQHTEDFELYQQLKLKPNVTEKFEGKQSLKQKESKVFMLYRSIAVAASILFLFTIGHLVKNVNYNAVSNTAAIENIEKQPSNGLNMHLGHRSISYPVTGSLYNDPFSVLEKKVVESPNSNSMAIVVIDSLNKLGNKKLLIETSPAVTEEIVVEEHKDPLKETQSQKLLIDTVIGDNTHQLAVESNTTADASNLIAQQFTTAKTVSQFLVEQVKKQLVTEEATDDELEQISLGGVVTTKISGLIGAELKLKKAKEKADVVFAFKLGKFELSRVSGKQSSGL